MEKTRNYIKECYEGDRNNGVLETYFHHYESGHQKVWFNGEMVYLEMEEGQVVMAHNEKDFFYNVVLKDDKFIEMIKENTSMEYINECLGL